MINMITRMRRSAVARLALHCPPLVRFLPTRRPLQTHRHVPDGPARARDVVICLPGIGDTALDFAARGFLSSLRQARWSPDVVMVDAHYGYYADRSILEQLRQDVVLPAREAGYREIWLVGVSLGGFGALLYASRYAAELAGVLALAPFLGHRNLIDGIKTSGGLAGWTDAPLPGPEEPRALWRWLKASLHRPDPFPPVYLGYGQADRFAEAHRLLSASLPAGRVFTVPGGHSWPVWNRLWLEFLRTQKERLREAELERR